VALLVIDELVVQFGGVLALDGPSLDVESGSICGLIGPNGAGKTTLFNCISRLYTPQSGRITFDDQDVLARAPHEISSLGIARSFQNLGLFPSLSVRENAMLGAYSRTLSGFLATTLRPRAATTAERRLRAEADEVRGQLGRVVMAVRDAEIPASTLGVNLGATKTRVFAVSAAYATALGSVPWSPSPITT
jgi:branched-chain amino acid transport system ATP-binding protein